MNIGYTKVLFFQLELQFHTENGACPYYSKGQKNEGDTNSVLKELSVLKIEKNARNKNIRGSKIYVIKKELMEYEEFPVKERENPVGCIQGTEKDAMEDGIGSEPQRTDESGTSDYKWKGRSIVRDGLDYFRKV